MSKKEKVLNYKGFPVVRNGNILYYGNITDSHIVMLQVMGTEKLDDLDISQKIAVQLQLTDPTAAPKDRIVRTIEKKGLYEALDIASVWLNRAQSGK